MTRFLYSPYIKTVLVILFTLSLTFGALFTMDTLWALNDEDMIIYEFEEKFSDSRHLASITFDPEMILCSAFHNFFYTDDDNG